MPFRSTLLASALTASAAVPFLSTAPTFGPEATAYEDPLAELVAQIDHRFNDPGMSEAHWGVVIQSLSTGRTWYELNSHHMFIPASNDKILTGAAALAALGPEFTYQTQLLTSGEVVNGVLQGDLIVHGNGDPTLYTRYGGEPTDAFRQFAQELRAKGITQVTGHVIGDDNAWDDEHIGSGWPLDGLADWYSAEYGPLQFNENYVDIVVTPPAQVGQPVSIEPNVQSSYFTLVASMEIATSGRNRMSFSRRPGTNEILIRGRAVAGESSFEDTATITNPTLFYVTALKEVLQQEGIAVGGKALDCDDIPGWSSPTHLPVAATRVSPPLSDMLRIFMKSSQNMYGETFAHTLGWHRTGRGTFEAGREEREQLASFGVEPYTYNYSDGSGLSRYNWVSPRQITDILRGMRTHRHWNTWRDSLPIAGVDGTIRSRLRNTPAHGNVRAKTGTLSQVRALSGYVTTAASEEVVFSMIVNGYLGPTREAEIIQDDVLLMIASHTGRTGSLVAAPTSLEAAAARFE